MTRPPVRLGGRSIPSLNKPDRHPSRFDLGEATGSSVPESETDVEAAAIEDNKSTRIVLKTGTFPPDEATSGINITGYLCHAKRSPNAYSYDWEDVNHFDLRTLRAGEYVRIPLGPSSLKALFFALAGRYIELGGLPNLLADLGIITVDPNKALIVEGNERKILQELMRRDQSFWENVRELDTSNAIETKALQIQHQRRVLALAEFEEHLSELDWTELQWQRFFERNEWIFGLGLSYRYLEAITNQAHLGGVDVHGRGADKVDFMFKTLGDTQFTVLVDIKKPNTMLVNSKEYRPNIYHIGVEIAGGVSQLHSYCNTWQTEGARELVNAPDKLGAYTYMPSALLIAGRLSSLGNDAAKLKTFELFRQQLRSPQILTFDELFLRA